MTEEKAKKRSNFARNMWFLICVVLIGGFVYMVVFSRTPLSMALGILLLIVIYFTLVILQERIMAALIQNYCFFGAQIRYIKSMFPRILSKKTEIHWKSRLYVVYIELGLYEEAHTILTRLDCLYPVMSEEEKALYMINHLAYTKCVNPQDLEKELMVLGDYCSKINQLKEGKQLKVREQNWLLQLNQNYKYSRMNLDGQWKEAIDIIRSEPVRTHYEQMKLTYRMAECYGRLHDYANAKQCYEFVVANGGDTIYVSNAKSRLESLAAETGNPTEPLLSQPEKIFRISTVVLVLVCEIIVFLGVVHF